MYIFYQNKMIHRLFTSLTTPQNLKTSQLTRTTYGNITKFMNDQQELNDVNLAN